MNRPSRRQLKRQRIENRWRRELAMLRDKIDGMQVESVTVSAQIRDYGWRVDIGYTCKSRRWLHAIGASKMRKGGFKRALTIVERNARNLHAAHGVEYVI